MCRQGYHYHQVAGKGSSLAGVICSSYVVKGHMLSESAHMFKTAQKDMSNSVE